jgi:hypothetical protein
MKRKKLAQKLGISVQELVEREKWWLHPQTGDASS